MARTKLAVKDVRVPTKLSRALAIKAKFDDLDDTLDAKGFAAYVAAGAISPNDEVAVIDSTVAAQAMTLANGAVAGQAISVKFRTKTGAGTVKITPATFSNGTFLTLATQGQRATLIWTGATWTLRPGYDGVVT